ncbi:MAG: thiolase family protein [Nitrososphaerota archaeon]|jgi:acetyl-CoA C-acetyltransferase|uniref:thiolase family protein n=1 Tax=Candidatus Bathycorpusculum sp. TaxID=2994959 RepID=UPI002836EE15|nr:thiolase family protein [Candidatus Termiticorpusculum sp.]MCL2257208.1 thiolase family protein [Candidatus Termiticorpusculum sp.]MCL2292663.1 thiolase family protein [Candidatus Termiticorpusculum sp.]MDR0460909.1 thiolase family protein [Nitrososphaerota archaeon]
MENNRPVIVAVGRTKFGEHYGKKPEKLIEEAWLAASNECNLERKELDTCYMSDYFLPVTNKLGLEEGFLSELTELHVPMEVTRSFSAALKTACHAIEAGVYSTALVGGIEKMTDRWDKIRDDLMLLEDPWSYYAGGTPEANHELLLREYIKKHGIAGEDLERLYCALAQVAVKNHANGAKNPYAQFQRKISLDTVLGPRKAANRSLGLFDYAPISDGATALILTNESVAKKLGVTPVYIYGYGSATDYLNYTARSELNHFVAGQLAMQGALNDSGLNVWDIRLWEIYDQSTMMEMVSLEDLGYCTAGSAWKSIDESYPHDKGCYVVDGKELYVNMNGGLKADGNPLGAAGGAQIYELFCQLTGKAEQRQVSLNGAAPKYGGMLEFEGFGTKAYVNILGRD